MLGSPNNDDDPGRRRLLEKIEAGERRRRHKRRHPDHPWWGLGAFGIIGWSITVPTLIGVAVALWANSIRPGTWTLSFMLLGLAIGCWNAWTWVERERRKMEEERMDDDDE